MHHFNAHENRLAAGHANRQDKYVAHLRLQACGWEALAPRWLPLRAPQWPQQAWGSSAQKLRPQPSCTTSPPAADVGWIYTSQLCEGSHHPPKQSRVSSGWLADVELCSQATAVADWHDETTPIVACSILPSFFFLLHSGIITVSSRWHPHSESMDMHRN